MASNLLGCEYIGKQLAKQKFDELQQTIKSQDLEIKQLKKRMEQLQAEALMYKEKSEENERRKKNLQSIFTSN
jgi:predicted RNase H-like nuclease (RuvC/YqgF family)